MRILLGSDLVIPFVSDSRQLDEIDLIFEWVGLLRDTVFVDFPTITVVTHFADISIITKKYKISRINKVYAKSVAALVVEQMFKATDGIPNFHGYDSTNIRLILAQLSYLEHNDVDLLISDNAMLHHIASLMNLADKVYTTDNFIEKCSIENAEIDPYKGIIVEKVKFGTLNINDPFFDSFKKDYPEYNDWFKSKSNDDVYVAQLHGSIKAILKLKIEDNYDEFSDVQPMLNNEKTLKISSLKITLNGSKLFERFIKLIYDIALDQCIKQIYVTFYNNSEAKHRLYRKLNTWGFFEYGTKNEKEIVMLKRMVYTPCHELKASYPLFNMYKGIAAIQISPLFIPDLFQKSPTMSLEISTSRNAILKNYISKASVANIQKGTIIVFISKGKEMDKTVLGLGVVEDIHTNFINRNQFIRTVRKRSILGNSVLDMFWSNVHGESINAVDFLYIGSSTHDVTLQQNYENLNIDNLSAEQYTTLPNEIFLSLIKGTKYEGDFTLN